MFELEWIFKLVIAIIFSGLIGLEREVNDRPAGLRTHILVCIAATLLTIVATTYFVSPDAQSRLIQGLITGIGFLGAGTIINSHHHVSGLTTAAGLWVVAGVGIVLGLGYYYLALVGTILILLVLKLHTLERFIHTKR